MRYDPYDVETQYRDASNLNARITLHSRYGIHPAGWMRWAFDLVQHEFEAKGPMAIQKAQGIFEANRQGEA